MANVSGHQVAEESGTLSIGQVAARAGMTAHGLRFYEREGLMANDIARNRSGQRVYTEEDVDWVAVATILRGTGMPLAELRRYTELVRAGAGTEEERLDLLHRQEDRIRAQREQLDRCTDLLRFKIGVYEDLLSGS